uniref:PAS domain S-box protein n=1 Tax=Pseudomonas aeruginosa TaxID=287 RepID=UPI000946D437
MQETTDRKAEAATPDIDYRLAFEHAPVGMVVSRHRAIVACNRRVCEIFGATPSALVGHSFSILYPSLAEFERIGKRMEPIMNASGHYADNRMMRRLGNLHGAIAGETFWCHVTGHAMNRAFPHDSGIWPFEDLGSRRATKAQLTRREREPSSSKGQMPD